MYVLPPVFQCILLLRNTAKFVNTTFKIIMKVERQQVTKPIEEVFIILDSLQQSITLWKMKEEITKFLTRR